MTDRQLPRKSGVPYRSSGSQKSGVPYHSSGSQKSGVPYRSSGSQKRRGIEVCLNPSFTGEIIMRLSFYTADKDYCDFLRTKDPCVPYTMDFKSNRPFVGVVLEINRINYYAPLTSPKPKHMTMKNQIDFYKINGGKWGAINFNNMIPIHENSLRLIDIKNLPDITDEDMKYKNLLINQLSWCNANRTMILAKAKALYQAIVDDTAFPGLKKRCCDFRLDESLYQEYAQNL
jgi:protein AbiQ